LALVAFLLYRLRLLSEASYCKGLALAAGLLALSLRTESSSSFPNAPRAKVCWLCDCGAFSHPVKAMDLHRNPPKFETEANRLGLLSDAEKQAWSVLRGRE
jgi:hypothetical protein